MTSAHSILPLLSTILLLYSAATTAVSGQTIRVPVRDTDGDPVLSGVDYYITGALQSNGNGLHLIHLNDTCRNNVKVAPPKFGPKVVLYQDVEQPSRNETINVNENVRIASSIPVFRICDTSWWLNAKTRLVTVGAIWTEVHNRRFRIVPHRNIRGYYYNILYCPVRGSLCFTLGVKEQLLGLSNTPLTVQFQKASLKVSEVSAAMHSTA